MVQLQKQYCYLENHGNVYNHYAEIYFLVFPFVSRFETNMIEAKE